MKNDSSEISSILFYVQLPILKDNILKNIFTTCSDFVHYLVSWCFQVVRNF